MAVGALALCLTSCKQDDCKVSISEGYQAECGTYVIDADKCSVGVTCTCTQGEQVGR